MIEDGYTYLTANQLLAQGSKPPVGVALPFDLVVLAADEYQPHMSGLGFDVLHVPLDDSGPPPTEDERRAIRAAAREVARRIRAGDRVLVTCWQGRNRSGVIAGLALAELGVPGVEAARRIQRLRNGLTNIYFRDMVVRS